MNGFTQSSYTALFLLPSDEDYKTLRYLVGYKVTKSISHNKTGFRQRQFFAIRSESSAKGL